MRILFSFAGGNGHFQPLVPIARAARHAGHVVAVTGEPAMTRTVESEGFTAFASGTDTSRTTRGRLLEYDPEREDRALRDGYAGRLARSRAADLLALFERWRPDVVVCDEVDFGCMVAAERLDLPYATVVVIASGSFLRRAVVAEPLHRLRAEHGLPPDPGLQMLSRHLVLSPAPRSYRDPGFELPVTGHPIRLLTADRVGDPPWRIARPGAATVYVTLGTVFNLESGDLLSRVLDAVRDLPVNVLATVGRQIDPAEFGPQPGHVHIERYIPQSDVLGHCDVVVSHGGSGSVLAALTHGLPMVLLPMGADQPHNAARCTRLGLARTLDPVAATPTQIREAVSGVLGEPAYRRNAARLAAEIAAQPGPEQAVAFCLQLPAI